MPLAMGESGSVDCRLPDGTVRTVPAGTPVGEVLSAWAPDRASSFLAGVVDGVAVDLAHRLERPATVGPLTFEDRRGFEIVQHSAAHLVAKSLLEVVPAAQPTAGPPGEEGFYYDFDVRPLTPEDLGRVEEGIQRAVRAREPFERIEVDRPEALRLAAGNAHKLHYLAGPAEGERISFYRTGGFLDLCRGPHVPDTGWLAGIKILGFSAVAGHGPSEGRSLQRIRGIGFPTRDLLKEYLRRRQEAEARDHRVLGAKLGLFLFTEECPGLPFWLPKGMVVVRELERFVTEHLRAAGYWEIRTPLLFPQTVFETSGHWEHYRENMFLTAIEERPFGVKPMNCPGAMLIFGSTARSYRELPLRLAEFAPLHRLEASGTIHGMTRVREFVQDDAHIFVTEEQIAPEVRVLLEWIRTAYSTFHLEYSYELSTRPAQFLGTPELWERAEATLEAVLKESGVAYKVSAGEGAFYGPKIDIHIRDSLGRPWQTGTIQLDYQMPQRFGLSYQGPDGALHTPVVVHRTILGTWERFFGILLEHTGGRLPPWLAPVQVRVLPISERHMEAALALVDELRNAGIRAESSDSSESIAKRVREAEVERIPYIAVLGDREVATGTVALRLRGDKTSLTPSRAELLGRVTERVRTRAFDP